MFKKSFEKKMVRYVRQFFADHPNVKLIAVTGSAGKTSAKMAVSTLLSQQFSVAMHEDEPRTHMQTLLQIMGVRYPSAPEEKWSFWQRRKMIRFVKKRARAEHSDAHVIVQEFSPSEIGFQKWFRSVIVPDITIVTSVTTGRMHIDYDIEDVAAEILELANNSRFAVINRDDINGQFAAFLTNAQLTTYGTSPVAEYYFEDQQFSLQAGHEGLLHGPEYPDGIKVILPIIGEHNLRPVVAAFVVAVKLGLAKEAIEKGLTTIRSLPGRMNMLRGADQTMLIDDSYSSSPLTALAALQSLYNIEASQKIVVFGSMNGLRQHAAAGHAELGSYCSPDKLDWVVTVGQMANQYLAPAARQKGCQVKECRDALEAGGFVREKLHTGGVALFKGSSGGVWLEEAVKINLHSIDDESRLVRQSSDWLRHKNDFFSRFGQ